MKKLLVTAIGAAAAFSAFALPTISTLRFNDMAIGPTTVADLNTAQGTYWSEPANATNTYAIEAMGTFGNRQTRDIPAIEGDPTKALSVKTTFGKPLSVNVVEGGTATNINAGIYFDSLVKFTVCEDAPEQEYAGAKIAMWLQEKYDANDEIECTNLVVRAGYLSYANGSVQVSNATYVCGNTISGNFADSFHRVTIKAIGNITTSGTAVPGFAIYIDGNDNGTCDFVANRDDEACWDSSFTAQYTLTEAAAELARTEFLFPSLIQSGEGKTTLTAASFDGTGSLSDIIFTANAPAFAKDYVAPKASVTIGGETTECDTFADVLGLVNVLSEGQTATVQLMKGLTMEAPITFEGEGTIILDFAGFVLTNEVADAVITNAAVSLIVTNSVGNGGIYSGVVNGEAIHQTADGAIAIAGGNFWADNAITVDAGYIGAAKFISGGAFADNMSLVNRLVDGKAFADDPNPTTGLYEVIDYVAPTYTVTYIYGNGGQLTNSTANLSAGDPTPAAPDASVAGYTYVWDPATNATVTGDATYTAQYTAINYEIKFVYGLEKEETNTVSATYYQSVSVPVDSTNIVGYTATWTPTIENGAVTVTHDQTYEATYTPIEYTITFVAEGGTVNPSSTNYTIASGTITLPTAVHGGGVGLEYDGWTNETYSAEGIKTFTPVAGNLGDFTLYAKWTAGGPTYPSYIDPTDTTIRNQYNTWAEANNVTDGDGLEAFFLLNRPTGGVTPVLTATEITISGTTVLIDLNYGNVNGYPFYKAAATVAGLANADPIAIAVTPADGNNKAGNIDNGGLVTITGQSGDAAFYQIGISSTPIPAPNP